MARHGRPYLVNRAAFATRLRAAIERNNLTYEEVARRARQHLPSDGRLSAVSVWQYAKAKSFPRRMSYIEALGRALSVDPGELVGERGSDLGEGEAPAAPDKGAEVRLTDLGDGRAALFVDTTLPWPVALKVLETLKNTP